MKCKHDLVEVTKGFSSSGNKVSTYVEPLLKCKKCLDYFRWDGERIAALTDSKEKGI